MLRFCYRVRELLANLLKLIFLNLYYSAEWLSQEEDPNNLEELISALVHWKHTDSLPELRELWPVTGFITTRSSRSVSEAILALEA
jgi:hypothetical protein